MNTVSYTPTLTSLNLQIIRSHMQNVILNCSEALSSISLFKSKNANNNDLRRTLVDIVVNQEKYIIDKLLIPLIAEINRNSERLPDTFYESRFGFTQEELLNAQYNSGDVLKNYMSISYPKRQSFLFNNHNSLVNSHQYVAKRGFKTRRQLREAEEVKNSGFLQKLANEVKSTQSFGEALAKKIELTNRTPIGKIRMSTSSSSTPSLDEKVKLAFAEGYLANSGTSNKNSSFFTKISSFFSFTLTIILLCIIL